MTDDELRGNTFLFNFLKLGRDMLNMDKEIIKVKYQECILSFSNLENQDMAFEYIDICTCYFYNGNNKITHEDMEELVSKINKSYSEGGAKIMTLAEQLHEEGRQKGMQKGMQRGQILGAIKIYREKLSLSDEDITNELISTFGITKKEASEYTRLEQKKIKYLCGIKTM